MQQKNWTKREMKGFVKLAKTKSAMGVAKHYGVSTSTAKNIAFLFGKNGIKVSFAPERANISALIKEVSKELK